MSAILAIICGLAVVGLDQLTKYLVTVYMEPNEVIAVIPGLINFNRIPPNTGAAFGMLAGQTWFLITVTCVVMIMCIAMLIRKTFDSRLMFWALCLVLGGGLGNLIDRIFRGGSVVDFLEFGFFEFPVFNVADCAVCIGAGLILLYFIMDFVKDARRKTDIDAINAESDTEIEQENTRVGESNNDN
ncbi:MAG: signal peptidase II [Clostridia bacterium]|nr:signal peptidase II [Clostridia bacterium]